MSEMFATRVRKLLKKFSVQKDAKVKSLKKTSNKKNKKEVELPDNVLSKIFDYSSPVDVARWRGVNRQFNKVAEERNQTILYLDVLRMDIHDILPRGSESDGDFHLIPKTQLLIHQEKRSILLAAHSHWTPHDARKMLQTLRFFGKYARTISLDASIAELCVAGQSTGDIGHWFAYQTSAASVDSNNICGPLLVPGWLPEDMRVAAQIAPERVVQWNPKTQRIPIGPLFPQAREVTFRASMAQLQRLRRLSVYRVKPTCIFSTEQLQMFRVSITAGRRCAPTSLRIQQFHDWLNTQSMAGKFCLQFC